MAEIDPKNLPRIRELIVELNSVATQRKECTDRLWVLEERGEILRIELMKLLNHP